MENLLRFGGGEETGQGHDGKASLNFFKMIKSSIFSELFNHEIFEIQIIVIPNMLITYNVENFLIS